MYLACGLSVANTVEEISVVLVTRMNCEELLFDYF